MSIRILISLCLAMLACSTPPRERAQERSPEDARTEDARAEHARAEHAKPVTAPPTAADQRQFARRLNELGKRQRDALNARFPRPPAGQLLAFGPCVRPGVDEKKALERRVLAWTRRTAPGQVTSPDDAPSIRFGCVEKSGIVVDVQVDRTVKGPPRADVGHWWTLRVANKSIVVLAQVTGLSTQDWMEWATETSLSTLALADLDGDGLLDVVSQTSVHEGGATSSDLAISVIRSKDGKKTELLNFHGVFQVARAQPRDARPAIVVVQGKNSYRCLEATSIAQCPEAVTSAARRFDRALSLANDLRVVRVQGLPHRDRLDEILSMLDVPEPERRSLLAMARKTMRSEKAKRLLDDFLASSLGEHEDLTDSQRAQARSARAEEFLGRLRSALGDQRCPDDIKPPRNIKASLTAWLTRQRRGARNLAVTSPCPGYFLMDWERASSGHRGLFFVNGKTPTLLFETASKEDGMDGYEPTLEAMFYRRGASSVALVIDREASRLLAFRDGKPIGTRDGGFTHYYHEGYPSNALVFSRQGDQLTFWHADTGLEAVASFTKPKLGPIQSGLDPVARLLAGMHQKLYARAVLRTFGGTGPFDTQDRESIVRALHLLGADRQLIEQIEAL